MSAAYSKNQNCFSPTEMMAEAEKFALSKAKKTSGMILGLSVMAGAFIGLAFLFISRSQQAVHLLVGG